MRDAARDAVARAADKAGLNLTRSEVTLLADEALAAIKRVAKESARENALAGPSGV